MIAALSKSVYAFLSGLNFEVSENFVDSLLKRHPDFPSLVSITDTLDELNIPNVSLIADKGKLQELPTPFLTHSPKNGGEFLVVNNIDLQIRKDKEFEKYWNGIIVLAEKPAHWSHFENVKALANEKAKGQLITFSASVLILMAGLSLFNQFSFLLGGLVLVTVFGLGISILIVQQEMGISNEFSKQLCKTGKITDCNAVINFKGSKFSTLFNWADVGIIYYVSFLILLVTIPSNPILSFLSIAAIPFIFFSVYYQWQIVKKWCTLCLIILSTLSIQAALLFPSMIRYWNNGIVVTFSINNLTATVFVFITISVTWLLILKPVLKKNTELTDKNYSLERFKNNTDIFQFLLKKQKQVRVSTSGLGIILGNPNAKHTIIKVCNPNCLPCSKAHIVIDEILENNKNVKVQIIYMVADDNNDKSKTVKHFMALYEKNDTRLIKEALDYWYADVKDYNDFSRKYSLNGELETQGMKLDGMKKWCDETDITFTPTFFLNGFQLPDTYKISDLKYLLNTLN